MIMGILVKVVDAYTLLIFIYVIMSWIPNMRGLVLDIYEGLGKLCEPYLGLFRRVIPPIGGMVDVSPIVAIVVLQLIMRFLYWLI